MERQKPKSIRITWQRDPCVRLVPCDLRKYAHAAPTDLQEIGAIKKIRVISRRNRYLDWLETALLLSGQNTGEPSIHVGSPRNFRQNRENIDFFLDKMFTGVAYTGRGRLA
jgi:hypothetical protein